MARAAEQPSLSFSFEPIHDACFIGDTRYNDDYLRVRAGSRVSYLMFTVKGLSGTVRSATLKLQENGDQGDGTFRVHRGSHNDWTEDTLSIDTAPLESGEVGNFTGTVTRALVVDFDVTPLLTADGTYSFIVTQDSGGNGVRFGSKESSRKPILIIETVGVAGIGPIYGLTATGNAGTVTSIHGIPVSDLLLGMTQFPEPPASTFFPAENADNFDLNLLGSADGQPYFDCSFEQPVMSIFMLENSGNDSGFMQALDAEGNLVGDRLSFRTNDFLRTALRSGNGQNVAGLTVWMAAPVYGIRVTPTVDATMGFDPISISASPLPRLDARQDPQDGTMRLVWFGSDWVLQQASAPDGVWSDVSPAAVSPHQVLFDGPYQLYRLRASVPE